MEQKSKKLIQIGVDVFHVVNRLGGNELLYLSICQKFVKDMNYQYLKDAISANDLKTAAVKIHELKGIAANLGFIRFEGICKALLDSLRVEDMKTFYQGYGDLSKEYQSIISILLENEA
jgi:HPt (histidine-containing phosphotransfer) domain-containing protein